LQRSEENYHLTLVMPSKRRTDSPHPKVTYLLPPYAYIRLHVSENGHWGYLMVIIWCEGSQFTARKQKQMDSLNLDPKAPNASIAINMMLMKTI
jgi:hypothetical protein